MKTKKCFSISLLVMTLASNIGHTALIGKTREEDAETRIMCHNEYDYLSKGEVQVCGPWTDLPQTQVLGYKKNVDLDTIDNEEEKLFASKFDYLYDNWISKLSYTNQINNDLINLSIDGQSYFADVFAPSEYKNEYVWGVVKAVSEMTQADEISYSYQRSSSYSVGFSLTNTVSTQLGINLGGGLDASFSASTSYTASTSITTNLSKTVSNNFKNTESNRFPNFQILNYSGFLPVEVHTYERVGKVSYIKYKSYMFVRVRDTTMKYWPGAAFSSVFNDASLDEDTKTPVIVKNLFDNDEVKIIGELPGEFTVVKS